MEGFEFVDGCLKATVITEAGIRMTASIGPLFDNGLDAWRFLDAAEPFIFKSDSYSSRNLSLTRFRTLVRHFYATGVHVMPKSSEEWQAAIVKIYSYHLNEQIRSACLKTRLVEWQEAIKPLLEFLRDIAHLIPALVKVPPKHRVGSFRSRELRTCTLVSGNTNLIKTPTDIRESSALLLNLDLSKKDAEYLENFRDNLIEARAALDTDCVNYITSMAQHFQYGQRLLKMFSEAEADKFEAAYQRKENRRNGKPYFEMRRHLEQENFPGATEISFARLLRFFARATPNNNLKKMFTNSPWLPDWASVRFPESAPQPSWEREKADRFDARRFRWMLGLVDDIDLSLIHLLLTIRNPRFNALPLFDATIKDKHDLSNFKLVIDGVSFSVNKRRAVSRKSSTLDSESIFAITTLLQMTKRVRDSMGETNLLKNRLFFASGHKGPKAFQYGCLYAAQKKRLTLRQFLPKTSALHTQPNHISAARVRKTAAVLEWFATGSVLAAARKLGNTTKVVIKHYIPEDLMTAWNTRLIRRFQNLLLATAAADEPHLLRATDFSTPEELKAFITDMLSQHGASSSNLAAIMHGRFKNPEAFAAPEDSLATTNPSSLVVDVTATNLAVLYAFRDIAYEKGMGAMVSGKENTKEISPGIIVDLADLLNTRLPDHHDPRFRVAHSDALLLAPHIAASLRDGAYATYEVTS